MEATVDRSAARGESIKVAVVDDHQLMRDGVRKALTTAAHIEVVGEAATGEQALELVADIDVDVVLLDYRLPDRDGIEVLKDLRRDSSAKVVMLSHFDDERVVRDAVANGASGYLAKADIGPGELIDAVTNVQNGHDSYSPDAATSLASSLRGEERDPSAGLTPREIEVWRLIAEGMTNSEIARRLFVSVRTAKFHASNLFRKIGAGNRAEAACMAHRSGISDRT